MVKKISIISVTPPSVNPGMILSDAMAKAFIDTNKFTEFSTFFRTIPESERLSYMGVEHIDLILQQQKVGIDYEVLSDSKQLNGSVPLFWGDFLHENLNMTALRTMYPDRANTIYCSSMLTDHYSSFLDSAVTFGTTYIHNRTSDYTDCQYAEDLNKLIKSAAYVKLRDPFSAAFAQQIRSSTSSCLGIDVVQLIHLPLYREYVLPNYSEINTKNAISVYFSRYQHQPAQIQSFVELIATTSCSDIDWIDWGDGVSFPHSDKLRHLFTDKSFRMTHPYSLLRQLASSSLVITDTYHCAIAAWAVGTPAIMVVGEPHSEEVQRNPVHFLTRIDKRATFYGQYGILDYMITPALLNNTDAIKMTVQEKIHMWSKNSKNTVETIVRIYEYVEKQEQLLYSALTDLIQ